jgi:hypothetical protein
MEKYRLKRTLIIFTVASMYIIGIGYALVYLPFPAAPEIFNSLFSKNWYGSLVWIIIRHKVAVAIIGGLLSLLLVKYDDKTAQIDANIIGALSILYCVIFKWYFLGIYVLRTGKDSIFTWIDVTDYLAIGVAIPLLVAIINSSMKRIQQPSKQSL